jgi:potassium efflux system protein
MAILAAAGWLLTRPRGGLFDGFAERHSQGWLRRLPSILSLAVLAIPVFFAYLAIAGYTHTSFQLTRAVFYTVWLVAGLIVFVQVAGRVLEPDRRPHEADAVEAAEQALRLLQWGAIDAVLLGLWGLWANLVPAVSFLRTIDLWSVETAQGVTTVTVASLLLAFVSRGPRSWSATTCAVCSIDRAGEVQAGRRSGIRVRDDRAYAVLAVDYRRLRAISIAWSRVQWLVADSRSVSASACRTSSPTW